LQTEIQDASVRRHCCGCFPDEGVFEVPRSATKHLGSSPPKPQSIMNSPGHRPDGLSSRSWWGPLPWRMSVKLVSPTDVGLQVGDASRWPEDFLHLDGQSRHVYGSWFQRDYLHDHLAAYRDSQRSSTRGSPRDLGLCKITATSSSSPFVVSNSLLEWTSARMHGIGRSSVGSSGIQSISRRITGTASLSQASRP